MAWAGSAGLGGGVGPILVRIVVCTQTPNVPFVRMLVAFGMISYADAGLDNT